MGTWTYIEGTEKDVLFRGFVPTECLSGTVTTLREAEKAIVGSWKLYAGTSIDASRIVFHEDGSVTGRTTLESGREVEWNGSWQLDYYDSNRSRYWNDSEFELTLSRGTSVELYGLRIKLPAGLRNSTTSIGKISKHTKKRRPSIPLLMERCRR